MPRRPTTPPGPVFTVTGQDWDSIVDGAAEAESERIVSTWARSTRRPTACSGSSSSSTARRSPRPGCGIGYLHTGIEKNMEYRNWTQGVTFCTRMDYLAPFHYEASTAWRRAAAGHRARHPGEGLVMRVLLMELNRISSHLVAIATGGMEIGALTVMTIGFRERELVLDLFELITGPAHEPRVHPPRRRRTGHAARRPRGHRRLHQGDEQAAARVRRVLQRQPDLPRPPRRRRATSTSPAAWRLGITGPVLASTGYPWDLRKEPAVLGLRDYEFDVPIHDSADAYGRFRIRLDEMWESLRIVKQCADRLGRPRGCTGHGRRQEDRLAGPAGHRLRRHGQLTRPHPPHHGRVDGGADPPLQAGHRGLQGPPGQAYNPRWSRRAGELSCHLVSDGGTRPYRAHFRDPSFVNLQGTSVMSEGGMISDVVVAIASIDPVMGGVDR
jgi:NADH-quinone oxidoreductase subunit D